MNQKIYDICQEVRKKAEHSIGIEGSCREVSLTIAYEVSKQNLNICVCIGKWKPTGEDHYWLRNKNTIYDATATQFGQKELVLVVEESKDSPYEEETFIHFSAYNLNKLRKA